MKSDRGATIYNAGLHVWFDGGPEGEREARGMFEALAGALAAAGFAVGPCERTARDYPTLADTRKRGRHGDLCARLGCFGRAAEAEFWSESGGNEYDYDRVSRMPYLTRKRWEWTRAKLVGLLAAWNVPLRGKRHVSEGDDPLDAFNDAWGADRFRRGPDGWPSEEELKSWRRADGDGVKVHSGETRFVRDGGRWVRCRVYGGINGMWLCVCNGALVGNVGAWELRSTFPGRGRHFEPREVERTLERSLARAVNEKQFLRAHAISGALAEVRRRKGAA